MASEKNDLKQYYTCKRKPDIVTWAAIGLFLIVILMQVYLVAFLPIQLKSGETLAYNVSRDKMLLNIDKIRTTIPEVKAPSDLAEGEVQMTKSAFDRLMLYTREHRDQLDLAQITELSQRFQKIQFLVDRWTKPAPQYALGTEQIDKKKYIRMLEQRIQEQETLPQ